MPDSNLTKLVAKNYQSFIRDLPGAGMWRHLFVVDQQGNEIDVMQDGKESCAYMVSSVLTIFQLIDRPHATIKTTIEEMEKAGWYKIDSPMVGAIIEWPEHIGFYLADDFVVSNSSTQNTVARHGLVSELGQSPIGYYFHPKLIDNKNIPLK